MEIYKWKNGNGGMMVKVSKEEAISIIRSLSSQLVTNDNNSERTEYTALFRTSTSKKEKNIYFSIAVQPK